MSGIPNTSKSPYYLRRIESRGPEGGAPTGDAAAYSLRSIPAWDPGYLGSSLLAKRLRKTLALIEDRINAVATGGVDNALLEQMIRTALDGMNLEGLSEAEVNALIATAVEALPDSATSAELDEFKEWAVAELLALAEAVQAVGAGGVDEAAVNALIEAQLTAMGPAIQQAIASQLGKLTDRATFNVSTAGDGQFVVETNNLTSAQHKVGIDFRTQRDGEITVNGKRVLTTDDALATGSVDTATLSNQLLMLQSRIDDLEAEMAEKVTMANVQGLLTGFTTAQQFAALTGRVTDLEGSTALKQARWVTEALTGDTTANATQINTAVAGLARTAYVQEQFANFNDLTQADLTSLAQGLEAIPATYITKENAYEKFNELFAAVAGLSAGGGGLTPEQVEAAIADAVAAGVAALETRVEQYVAQNDTKVQAVTSDMQTMWDTYAEQPGGTVRNFVDFHTNLTAFIPASMQSATVLQQLMDAFAVKANATVADVQANYIQAMGDYVQNLEQWTNQTFGEVVEYVSVEIENLKAALAALPTTGGGSAYGEWIAQALTGTLGATLAEVNRAVEALARKTDLAPYAKLNDTNQLLTAKSIIVEGIKIGGEGGGVLAYVDDEYGYRLRLIDPGVTDVADMGIVVVHHDLVDILGPGQKGLPASIGWTPCQVIDSVEARLTGTLVEFRGGFKKLISSSGTFTKVGAIPEGFPPPPETITVPLYAVETGTSYRIGLAEIKANGDIAVAGSGAKFDDIRFGGMYYRTR